MLTRYEPFQDLFRLHDQLLGRHGVTVNGNGTQEGSFLPAVDVYEDEEGLYFEAELPGLRVEDLDIELEKNVLTLSGERKLERKAGEHGTWRVERRYGRFERAFRLPDAVDPESVKADMADGVLQVRFAKKAEVKPRKIAINAAGGVGQA